MIFKGENTIIIKRKNTLLDLFLMKTYKIFENFTIKIDYFSVKILINI